MAATDQSPETRSKIITLKKGRIIVVDGIPHRIIGIHGDRVRLVRIDDSEK